MDVAETRYAKTVDDVNIAYQIRGQGPVDLVHIMGFACNFEVEIEEPQAMRFEDRLSSFARVILFDKRGSGMSDQHRTPDLEMRAEDLRAVLDAAGSERAILYGESEGGTLAAFFAASHPDRVMGLVLYGSQARYAWAPDYPMGMTREQFEADQRSIAGEWGTMEAARRWAAVEAPSRARDEVLLRSCAKAMRYGASPATAVAFNEMRYGTDIRAVLASVQAPTLVIWRAAGEWGAGDERAARYLADRIAGATYLELPGTDYWPRAGNMTEFLDAVEGFVRSIREEQSTFDRVLATVLFTDIVGSTEKMAALGDAAWKALLERHHAAVRAMIGRYRGVEVDTAGDGFFATFDGPARAVRCATAIVEALKPIGVEVRAGVHAGEVETIAGKVGGIAVSIGARVGALARPSEVLVSSTVKDLVAGSGLAFEDAGEHALKGVPARWHLYRAVG